MTTLVTGATGQLGRLAIEELLAAGLPAEQLLAGGRDEAKLDVVGRDLGVKTRRVDLADSDTIAAAMHGLTTLLLISTTDLDERQANHERAIDAALATGATLVVYTSALNADTAKMRLAVEHRATEAYLQASGVPYVILRNGWYIENYTDQLPAILDRGVVLGAAGGGRISGAARRDLAAAAAAAVTDARHAGATYELGGPAFTLDELAATISELSGRDVAYRDLSPDELVAALTAAGLPSALAAVLADSDEGIGRGELFTESHDLANLIGRAPTQLAAVVRQALPTTAG